MQSYIHALRSKVGHDPIFFNVACALIIDENGEILLQRRGDFKAEEMWGIPGGGMEIGESAEEAMRREVREETGLEVDVESFLGAYTGKPLLNYPNGDVCHMIIFIFVCRPVGGVMALDGDETLALKYFKIEDLPKLFGDKLPQIIIDYRQGKRGVIR